MDDLLCLRVLSFQQQAVDTCEDWPVGMDVQEARSGVWGGGELDSGAQGVAAYRGCRVGEAAHPCLGAQLPVVDDQHDPPPPATGTVTTDLSAVAVRQQGAHGRPRTGPRCRLNWSEAPFKGTVSDPYQTQGRENFE